MLIYKEYERKRGINGMQFTVYEEKILKRLLNTNLDIKDQARLKYGFYIVLDFFKKGLFVYLIAFFLETILETFLLHLGFMYLRQVTYGWHFNVNKSCYIGSIVIFAFLPYGFSFIKITSPSIYILTSTFIVAAYFLGPIETGVSKITPKKSVKLRRKLKKRLIVITVLVFIIPKYYYFFIILGFGIQLFTLLIQFLKNRRNGNVGKTNWVV